MWSEETESLRRDGPWSLGQGDCDDASLVQAHQGSAAEDRCRALQSLQ